MFTQTLVGLNAFNEEKMESLNYSPRVCFTEGRVPIFNVRNGMKF